MRPTKIFVKALRGKRRVLPTIALCLVSMAAFGQTVRPLIQELGNPAKGRVEYFNDSALPLNVVVQPMSFTVSETGEQSYRPLDPNIHLKLSATSFRIPPQQSYYLFYEASTEKAPAWFVIYASFSGFGLRTQQGFTVRLQLPHYVYLLPKSFLGKADVRVSKAEYRTDTKQLILEVENTGPNFGRVQQSWLVGRKRTEAPGFPLFPQSRRRIEYSWDGEGTPNRMELDFGRFKLDIDVQVT